MLILAFDTATDRATSALVSDGEVLGERVSRASTLLEDVDALLRQADRVVPFGCGGAILDVPSWGVITPNILRRARQRLHPAALDHAALGVSRVIGHAQHLAMPELQCLQGDAALDLLP